ncbi:hypothetical protein DSCO28_55190 [Desulfosarcina ovata subsp. sediminis]|uniref:Uncharacterized protein n=1 Tax=Desulfosarcina ovata subsp. sediminis TaxID=885957 RepID=A0A5K7ZXH3_9BACT|nr:hypothetical protein [Desulfosarcina ovata]BBO84953.1 hypothetical protein DSCO28_55190 [Desulfosarcina ovata subsp. sediminis]
MTKLRYLLFILSLAVVMNGCGNKMALIKDVNKIDISQKSIALVSVKISNRVYPNKQSEIRGVFICPDSKECHTAPYFHKSEKPYISEKDSFYEYLMSFELDPGVYNISYIQAVYNIPLLVYAGADIPINLKLEIKPKSVIYLGHIDITLRKRENDNEKRCAIFPLIDAAIAGYSSGTYDVVVEDRFDDDMQSFITEYPVLNEHVVDKYILPQWIRPENKKDNL